MGRCLFSSDSLPEPHVLFHFYFHYADGTGTAASFNYAYGLTMSSQDPSRLFLADYQNNRIRMIR